MNRAQVQYTKNIYIVLVLAISIALHQYAHQLVPINAVSCSTDSMISDITAKNLEQYIINTDFHTIQHTITELYQTYPWIQSISCNYAMPGKVHVHIKAHEPYVRLGDYGYMIQTGHIVSADVFRADYYQDLYCVSLNSALHAMPPSLYQCIQSIPDTCFDRFTIAWYDEHKLMFTDKQKPMHHIVCDASTVSFDHVLNLAVRIDDIVYQARGKIDKQTIIDCRFANQIIVYDAIGGNNGKASG